MVLSKLKITALMAVLLVLCASVAQAAFTEFYCDASAGANINAGDKTANGVVTSTNGAWSTVTNIFTATSGTPFSGVSVGDFASLYADGATVSAYVARVTAIGGGGLTLTLSSSAKSGTAPTTAGVGISCTTGGAWKGPNGASGFPLDFVNSAMADSAADMPRVNLKNNATYSITAAIASNPNFPLVFQGYSSSVGDGGKFTIDGGTSGASYVLLTLGTAIYLQDAILHNNGATGSATGLNIGQRSSVTNVVVHDVRGAGIGATSSAPFIHVGCEAYNCNQSNTASLGGFTAGGFYFNCIAHDNSGSNSSGFSNFNGSNPTAFYNCIADTNGQYGFYTTASIAFALINCDSYNNVSHGFNAGGGTVSIIQNCNFVKNGGYGIQFTAFNRNQRIVNCGFGSGTQANTSGQTNVSTGVVVTGSITYASGVTPWVDPANGDFRVNLAAAKGAGLGAFTQTQASYAGAIGYPDIGAAQHLEAPGGVSRTRKGTQ
jgi:hypothetical protein